jgi:3-oxoacyl-[acyl-carrier-protein] synthase-3
MFSVEILGTSSLLMGRRVTTAELVEEVFPGEDPARFEEKTGIRARHFVDPDTTFAAHGGSGAGARL